ncbi:MAG TPA: hypothetical protein VGH31_02665, partial [Acidimicrobiales bacterium]
CAHLWWETGRRDFSSLSAEQITEDHLQQANTSLAHLTRPFLPKQGRRHVGPSASQETGRPSIHYVSHHWSSGYGVAGLRLFQALADLGVPLRWSPIEFDEDDPLIPRHIRTDLSIEPYREVEMTPDVVVLHCVPELLPALRHLRPKGGALVLHTVWEHDLLQAHWPRLLNQFDGIIVPTTWNAEAFKRSGVRVPIAVVPHVANTDVADMNWLEQPPVSADQSFMVHSIASWSLRKAPWFTLEAFARAFDHSDALFVLQTSEHLVDWELPNPAGPPHLARTTPWTVASILRDHHPTGKVHVATRSRTFAEIQGLHKRSDCWLSLPRAEGWDLGAFDAATAGTPVITTSHGGPLEYLDPQASLLIPGRLIPNANLPGTMWMEPDIDAAVDALRAVSREPETFRARAAAQASRLRSTYAPDVVGRQFLAALQEMGLT